MTPTATASTPVGPDAVPFGLYENGAGVPRKRVRPWFEYATLPTIPLSLPWRPCAHLVRRRVDGGHFARLVRLAGARRRTGTGRRPHALGERRAPGARSAPLMTYRKFEQAKIHPLKEVSSC